MDVPYLFAMPESRFSEDVLIAKALAALEETVAECRRRGQLRASGTLRFTLTFLGNRAADRTPFDDFWRAVLSPDGAASPDLSKLIRSSNADGALFRIYCALGLDRPRRG